MTATLPGVLVWVAIVCCGLSACAQQAPASEALHPEITRAQTERWMTELSNWGAGARTTSSAR